MEYGMEDFLLYIGSLKSGGLTPSPPPPHTHTHAATSLMKTLSVVNENLYLLNYFPIETILFS
jgi:hypothetical protein